MSKKECTVMKDLMFKLTSEQRRKYNQLPREVAIELGPEFPGVLFVRRVRNG